MGAGFVLKGADGRPRGYVMQSFGKIRCGISAENGADEAVVFFADGSHARWALDGNGKESEWSGSKRIIAGAVAVLGGRAAAWTDEEAHSLFCEMQRKTEARAVKEEKAQEKAQEKAPEREEQAVRQERGGERFNQPQPAYILPQRRWPPPACMPQAAYRGGQWE